MKTAIVVGIVVVLVAALAWVLVRDQQGESAKRRAAKRQLDEK